MADQTGKTVEEGKGVLHKIHKHSPNSRQVLGFVTLIASGATILVLGGLALGGVAITLILAIPVLVVASPVLIPAGIVLFTGTAIFLAVGGAIAATMSALSWVYNYFKGRHPPGSDKLDATGRSIADRASQMRDMAREYGGQMQSKVGF
eukprot:c24298_g1_i1 orf=168-614(+)